MFYHVMVGTDDIERSKRFYDATLATLGVGAPIANEAKTGHMRYFYRHEGGAFCITEPIDDQPASVANGSTIGFRCASPEQVRQFHDAATANGGVSVEDPPGPRQGPGGVVHLAYVRDPDGHKLCAIYREG